MIWCEYGCPVIISGLTHDSQCYSDKGQGCGKWSNHEDFPVFEGVLACLAHLPCARQEEDAIFEAE